MCSKTTESLAKVAIAAESPALLAKANKIAQKLNLPIVPIDDKTDDFLLVVTESRIELRETKTKNVKPIYVDFVCGAAAHRRKYGGGKGQLIARAVGIKGGKRPHVLDVTAGLGQDAFVLASLGCKVALVERSGVIATLLGDGLNRLLEDSAGESLNMKLIVADAISYLESLTKENLPDVIYIDPMYPERAKAALGKREMRVLRAIVGSDVDSVLLLKTALKSGCKRVVVKRPLHADAIDSMIPALQFCGKSSRYDVYI